jgi:hypothetical protein
MRMPPCPVYLSLPEEQEILDVIVEDFQDYRLLLASFEKLLEKGIQGIFLASTGREEDAIIWYL